MAKYKCIKTHIFVTHVIYYYNSKRCTFCRGFCKNGITYPQEDFLFTIDTRFRLFRIKGHYNELFLNIFFKF
jgi:hypothetical protein